MELYLLCAFAFLAGFIDSIVGGGGLVQIPAFFVLYPHLSVPNVIGTNRLASTVGTAVAVVNYARNVKIPWKIVGAASLAAGICSYLGVTLQSRLPAELLKPIILVLIVGVAVYTFRKKHLGDQDRLRATGRLWAGWPPGWARCWVFTTA
jgi:Predicted permeases